METILAILITGILCIVCFLFGVNTAQKIKEDKIVELPTINPIKTIREHQEYKETKEEQKKEQNKIETIMRNIEAYDGTGNNQEDVPR